MSTKPGAIGEHDRLRGHVKNDERSSSEDTDGVPVAVLEGDDAAWRRFVARYDASLRLIVRQATEATYALTDDQIDDVMGDFWLSLLANDMRVLRSFNPERGASLLTWLTFHVANIANGCAARLRSEPTMLPLDEALQVAAPWPRPARPKKRREVPKLPSGRRYSADEMALLTDFAAFLVKLDCDGKLQDGTSPSDEEIKID